ncbi:MAG: class flavin-dependent oxidoreductase [Nevskia sp.]|nr:class flavin-dependent oxidoreductase [Nevskia sp.]
MARPTASKRSVIRENPRLVLSVLDLCKRAAGTSARESLRDTLSLARLVDTLGYKRFWIAEHHTDDAAQSCPEVLLPMLASQTKSLRIGAGGILLQYYSPLKVAELFLALEALFPGRMDLGICRGPGVTSPKVAAALVSGHDDELSGENFEQKLGELVELLRQARLGSAADGNVRASPFGVAPPPLWMLGSGPSSLRLAASHGTPYAYSLFFGGGLLYGLEFMADYRRTYAASLDHPHAQGAIAVTVVCADTDADALRWDAELVEQGCYKSNIVGAPDTCARTLKSFSELFGVDEIFVATFVQNPRARHDLYRHLAEGLHAQACSPQPFSGKPKDAASIRRL